MTDLTHSLAAAMRRVAGPGALAGLTRLSGGANMESWSFDWADKGYVLRRAPSDAFMADKPFGLGEEAALVVAARAGGVRAPEVTGVLQPADGLGTGYVMRRVEAEVQPARILAAPPPTLLADISRELARIHSLPRSAIPGSVPVMDPEAALAGLKRDFLAFGGDRPIIALAIKWCEDNLPAPCDPTLVHGDFRIGNIMVDESGLAAILDWELAHFGDPHEDLAYGCMTVWRFAALDRRAFGLGDLDALFAAYEKAGGRAVDRSRFRFWLIYRTLWWALGCLQMGQTWRSGADRSVERVVVGRRTAEQELDLLLLLEADASEIERRPSPAPAAIAIAPSTGEPVASELLEAVREWLNDTVKPLTEGHQKFEVAVAINALGIAGRDLDSPTQAEGARLSQEILSGTTDLARPGLVGALRQAALAKCRIDSPKYPALARAASSWEC